MKSFKQFINENLNNELTTEDLEKLMDENGNLDLSNRGLTSLPPLPDGLRKLWCSENRLTKLPPLPDGLKELSCWRNMLIELPPLPEGLKFLFCGNNKLTELPPLPDGLKELYCHDNNLSILPKLPKGLKELYCYNNPITKYDLPFPSTLKELSCDNLYGFTDLDGYKKWLEKQQWRKDNPDLATLDDIGLL